MNFSLTEREELLLAAALHADDGKALAAWRKWETAAPIEEAPHHELRLLPAVYARLSRISPSPDLPQKLKGKARATFTQNNILAAASRDALAGLAKGSVPVLLGKGIAFCLHFDAWSRRPMGDVDIYVPEGHLAKACELLHADGWAPNYGMTWQALRSRTAMRRESWNIVKEAGNIDLHWRFSTDPREASLDAERWKAAVPLNFRGVELLGHRPEFDVLTSLRHAFPAGTRADVLQMLVDAETLLPLCDPENLSRLLEQAGLQETCEFIRETLRRAGSPVAVPRLTGPSDQHLPSSSVEPLERSVLRYPRTYRLWQRLGHPAVLERVLLRLLGPMSICLAPAGEARTDYDLRDCATMDAIAGPGWGWPEPEHTCYWADRADARLLVPLPTRSDQLLLLSLSQRHRTGHNPAFQIFANGQHLADAGDDERLHIPLVIPGRILREDRVELSFRATPYPSSRKRAENIAFRRTVAASHLRIIDLERVAKYYTEAVPGDIASAILGGDEEAAAKLARIRERMAASPFRESPDLPPRFDALSYVLLYHDLFEHEVDPYQHYLSNGKKEGRRW